jgi:hypothetical protein
MLFVTFDVDGREGTRRTQILAGSTANAAGFVDGRDIGRLLVIRIARNHLNGSHRTVACTVATLHTIVDGHTVLLDKHGVTYLCGSLVLSLDGQNGTSGTNLRTTVALRATIATLVRHRGHHQMP